MNKLKNIIRVQEWWKHILPPILLFYYLGIKETTISNQQLYINQFLLIFCAIITAFCGYFINDLFDMEEDRKSGKKNQVANFPKWLKVLFLPIVIILLISVLFLTKEYIHTDDFTYYGYLFLLNLVLFFLYSLPFIRLKSNIWLAPLSDALYSGTLFYILAFLVSTHLDNNVQEDKTDINFTRTIYCILIFGIIRGLRNYLTHLCIDKKNDETSGAVTLATKYGEKKIQFIANLHYPFEILSLLFLFHEQEKNNSILYALFFIFFLVWLIQFVRFPTLLNAWLNDLYEIWLPLLLLIQLCISNNLFYPLLLFHLLFFPYYIKKIIHLLDAIYFYTIFRIIGPIRKK